MSAPRFFEAAAQLVFMAYLHRVVNGGGFIDREYAAGSGRVDLCVRWPHPGGVDRHAVELKVWREGRSDPTAQGLEQLAGYLERLGLDHGKLLVFDARRSAAPLPGRVSREMRVIGTRSIEVVRL